MAKTIKEEMGEINVLVEKLRWEIVQSNNHKTCEQYQCPICYKNGNELIDDFIKDMNGVSRNS